MLFGGDIVTRVHRDRADRRIIFERLQDVEPILDANKEKQAEGRRKGADFRLIGSIPNVIIEKWMNDEGANVLAMGTDEFAKFIRRKLNDPDWRHLRTDTGGI